MKRGQPRRNVSEKHQVPKSVSRRVKLTASGNVIHRNRMKRHLMLNRQVKCDSTKVLFGDEAKIVKRMLGVSLGGSYEK